MIVYKDIMGKLKKAGYSSYRMKKEGQIAQGTIERIRKNLPISTETINTICELTGCQPSDILEYRKSEE